MAKFLRLSLMSFTFQQIVDALDTLEKHVEIQDDFFRRQQRDFQDDLAKWPEEEIDEGTAEDYKLVVEMLPGLQWYGTFVMLWTFFEGELVALAQLHWRKENEKHKRDKKPWYPSSLAEEHQPLMYLENVAAYWKALGVAFPDKGDTWAEIQNYREVRNQIAHENGRLNKSPLANKRVRKRCKIVEQYVAGRQGRSVKGISLNREDVLVLTSEYCKEVICTFRKFLGQLQKELFQKRQR